MRTESACVKLSRLFCAGRLLPVAAILALLSCSDHDPASVACLPETVNEREFPLGFTGETITMVWMEPGSFTMGSPADDPLSEANEQPLHGVEITRGFWIGKYEVTQEQWSAVTGESPSLTNRGPRFPVENVSWNDIVGKFLPELNAGEQGMPWRLPSEAEWEYACRAGTQGRFSCREGLEQYYICHHGYYETTLEVGSLLPNPAGIHNMHGNVREWCRDVYHSNYLDAPSDGRARVDTSGRGRVVRGGAFNYPAAGCRSASREQQARDHADGHTGFRLVRSESMDNSPPSKPRLLAPETGREDVPAEVTFRWSCSDPDGDPLFYDLYLGDQLPPPLAVTELSDTFHTVEGLAIGTTFYWKVIAHDRISGSGAADITYFTTFTPVEHEFELAGSGTMITMILLPPGSFMMGSPYGEEDAETDEYPRHEVTLESGFWLGKYELTQEQWSAVVGDDPSGFNSQPNRPVENISWNDVHDSLLAALNDAEPGEPWRLPTEAEWEYACRAGTRTRYYWGHDEEYMHPGAYAWYNLNSGNRTHKIGEKQPNPWGFYDMTGNVMEWCKDWYHISYDGAPSDGGPWLEPAGVYRVYRGGGWGSVAPDLRAAKRYGDYPDAANTMIGVRLARSAE